MKKIMNMKYYTTNKKIIENTKQFFPKLKLDFENIKPNDCIVGWGKKESGLKAEKLASEKNCNKILLENGFLHSIEFKNQKLEFSIVKDKTSIYYDANKESDLENILNNDENFKFLNIDKKRINNILDLIIKNELTKYNENIQEVIPNFFNKDKKNILIISQVKDDGSLIYGNAMNISLEEILENIYKNNEKDKIDIYIKLHPDVLTKNKKNDISIEEIKKHNLKIISDRINPLNLLKHFDEVHTKTSQMGFEALLLNKKVYCYGNPFYAGWGLTIDKNIIERRTKKRTIEELAYAVFILYTEYYHPINKNKIEIEEVIQELIKFKKELKRNINNLYFFGFKLWKRSFIKKYFKDYKSINFNYSCNEKLLNEIIEKKGKVFLWGMNEYNGLDKEKLKENNIDIYRIEDGFLRSFKLGNSLYPPYSLIVDEKSIYFNAQEESDLENILNNNKSFNKYLIERSKKLIEKIKESKVSKYNLQENKKLEFNIKKNIILVIGQVEDDASIKYSSNNMNNLELLQEVRKNNKDAYIIYKPHPDVLFGDRKGFVEESKVLEYANEQIVDASLDSCINVANEIHTISSLSGFEALIRNKKVYCYGNPFYAGWGLTIDKNIIERRTKKRTIEELVAATYILYPIYYDYEIDGYSTPEQTIENISKQLRNKKSNGNIFTLLKKIKMFFQR